MKRILALVLIVVTLPTAAFAALAAGSVAPSFRTQASLAGKPYDFNLDAALRNGPVVLYFFPAAFSTGCTLEARAFAEAADRFRAQGATVIGVTAGNIARVQEFSVVECRNKFAVAADPGARITKLYKSELMFTASSQRISYVITPDRKIAHVVRALSPVTHVTDTLDAVTAWRRAQR